MTWLTELTTQQELLIMMPFKMKATLAFMDIVLE